MKETNKGLCASAYLMFFIPLLADSQNDDYKFHANQGLTLLIFSLIIYFLGVIIPVIGWVIILPIGIVVNLILFIIGIINALNGKNKELPVIGKIQLIK